jgi:hypothetical protein
MSVMSVDLGPGGAAQGWGLAAEPAVDRVGDPYPAQRSTRSGECGGNQHHEVSKHVQNAFPRLRFRP